MTVGAADVATTWLLTCLLTWRMTSAATSHNGPLWVLTWLMTWLSTWLMTSALTQPSFDPTRSPVNRVTGQPDWVNRSTRPGQRSTGHGSTRPVNGSTRSTVNRVNPVNTAQPCARAATRCPTRRPFWWRVRAREREFLGNFGTYKFVSKFPTIWYIDLACLKLLKT